MRYRHTDEEFAEVVKNSFSVAEICRKLNVVVAGGNYSTIKFKIQKMGLDTSHFTGQAWNRGKQVTCNPARPLDQILIKNISLGSQKLKTRLWKAGLLTKECSKCLIKDWLGAPLSLELDHIDGDKFNNTLENLRILCPNCHSQTSTFRGKNKIKTSPGGNPV